MDITIKYDGAFPNLCSGNLVVVIDGKSWDFGNYCLSSGGSVSFDEDWSEHVTRGKWKVTDWPKGFPKELKASVVSAINEQISQGCCGGCV